MFFGAFLYFEIFYKGQRGEVGGGEREGEGEREKQGGREAQDCHCLGRDDISKLLAHSGCSELDSNPAFYSSDALGFLFLSLGLLFLP
jgi:hypothetical protein